MKRERDPGKPRRKWAPSGSPGRRFMQANGRRLVALEPEAGPILEQLRTAGLRMKARRK